MSMLSSMKDKLSSALGLSSGSKTKKIGIYGPPNSGKSTFANKVCEDWTGESLGTECPMPHETRRAQKKENVVIEYEDRQVEIDVVDTPGVTTEIDEQEFIDAGMDCESSRRRAREATEGVAEAMHWLREDVDGVIYMMDATEDPFMQTNTMLLGIIESRELPVIVLANKIDLEESDAQRIANAFPQHTTVPVSAKERENTDDVYQQIAEKFG